MTDDERMATICHLEQQLERECRAFASAHGDYLWMAHVANQSQDPKFATNADDAMRAKMVHRVKFKRLAAEMAALGEPDRSAAWIIRFEMERDIVEQMFRGATAPPKPKRLETWEMFAIMGAVLRGDDGSIEASRIPRKWKRGVITGAIRARRSARKRKGA